ncbi:hypothetical protein LSUE1_G004752 [Lachnellula suecica]|uniref:Uncharacterized protein n=1 Tax=Lachnellula suecica TaxID=602035 RepID=A0A8T9C9G0_9HELO|nr:hypothetical protein LSUE1_G004752 [Lachnellula suecica]
MPNFSDRIQEIMGLRGPMPRTIAKELQLDHHLLRAIDSNFKALATDLHIWSFFETIDSDLTNPDLIETDRFPFHAPITSIKSALLNLRHEVVYPLLSDHAHCASFDGNNSQAKISYLNELAHAVKKACELSKTRHTEMKLEDKVQIEVNGFYEGTVLSNEPEPPPIRIWSTSRSLRAFKRWGPAKLLEDRLAEVNIAPREAQHLRHNTRAASLVPDRPNEPRPDPPGAAFNVDPFGPFKKPGSNKHGKKSRKGKMKEQAAAATNQKIDSSTSLDKIGGADTLDLGPTDAGPSRSSVAVKDSRTVTSPKDALGISTPSQPTILEPPRGGSLSINGMNQARRHSEVPNQPFMLRPDIVHRSSSPRGRRGSESAINPAAQVTFSKPDVSNQRLVWVHVPYNNPSWVKKDVLEAISVEKGPNHYDRLLSIEHWESKHVRGRHAEHHACFVKPGCSFIGAEITSPSASPRGSPRAKPVQMCLYLPFLHFDTYKALVKRRRLIKRRIRQGRSRPVPQSISKLESLELKVVWQFLGHDPPINCRRTLDQFGYPGLLDTRARDDDQMLYKMTKQRGSNPSDVLYEYNVEEKGEADGENVETPAEGEDGEDSDESESGSEEEEDEDILDGNVLMVDQVWLWVVDSTRLDRTLFQGSNTDNQTTFREKHLPPTEDCTSKQTYATVSSTKSMQI